MSTPLCPCGSEIQLSACCQPLIKGVTQAKTAEQLLRSRYTAFTLAEVDYIISTHHSKTRHEVKREEIEDWAKNSKWLGLKVAQVEAGSPTDEKGTIVFCAQFEDSTGKKQDHWEQSYFDKEDGVWKFMDAQGLKTGPYRREAPKAGRNDPCTCGSGLKLKKCHGK
ncbi:YchJ family metal-binding protein [Bdellovibrionota bacterium FG-1]